MVASYRSGNGNGVTNLIAGLNATGHVTHTQHRKDKVTFHHNGGRLSHQGVLNVWKTREASAHFDVDAAGNVAQYVEMNEYAWACGNTEGNQRSISIEMCNEATNGKWPVSETTWREAARLAGWIHAKVFGFRPSRDSVVPHHHWKSTTCAGPYMDDHYDAFVQVAQQAYDFFRSGGPSNPVTPPPAPGKKSISEIADEVIQGKWGNGDTRRFRLQQAGYDAAAVQNEVNRKLGGGDHTPPPAPARKSNDEIASEVLAGAWGNGDDRRNRLQQAGYNYDEIQRIVNTRVGNGAPAAHRSTLTEIARQVIAGHYGNGAERRRKLEGAGWNYASVQAEVNRLLR
jgi:CW_7 repeat/N-acetylmuramoyl-L-alanine amidase